MFTTKKRNRTQFLLQLTAMIMILLLLAGCGGKTSSGKNKPDNKNDTNVAAQQDERQEETPAPQKEEQQVAEPKGQEDDSANVSGSTATAAQSYSAYMEAKGEFYARLVDALVSNPDTLGYSMTLLGVGLVDLALVPVSTFGLGQGAAVAALGLYAVEDVEYTEKGNHYSVKYRNSNGEQCEVQGEYDKKADALKCVVKLNGKEIVSLEYCKTSFGYVSQTYSSDEGSTFVYYMAISGGDGVLGVSEGTKLPPPLTGNETMDFPKQCPEWFAISGNTVTGVTSDGTEISFTYTPQ